MQRAKPHRFAAVVLALLTQLSVGPEANATWSIVLADTETRAVGVASATCWDGQWLRPMLPVIRVGRGAANCQATWDHTGVIRQLVAQKFDEGCDPALAISQVEAVDPFFEYRQIGVADVFGGAAAHTGSSIPQGWNGGVHGQQETLVYSISGNRLAGPEVIDSVKNAVLSTPGDLAEKLMQGMLAAYVMGGDGRCSCNLYAPDACGAPPSSFTKSAHVGYMLVARPGDADGDCSAAGCATGEYYLALEVGGVQKKNPDPVLQLQSQMEAWRQTWVGRPDHFRSTVELSQPVLGSFGVSQATLTVSLVDWQGAPLHEGGALVQVMKAEGGDGVVLLGPVQDHEDGTYSCTLTAKAGSGRDGLRVVVDDHGGPVLLGAVATVIVAEPAALDVDLSSIEASGGSDVAVSIDVGAGMAGQPYALLASASGTTPGFDVEGLHVPLNPDFATWLSIHYANTPSFAHSAGFLDPQGRAQCALSLGPGAPFGAPFQALTFSVLSNGYASAPLPIK